jgi:TnpA family transposase
MPASPWSLAREAARRGHAAVIDDESYRRRMSSQINIQEGRHRLARKIFHGRRGQLRQRYREGQEDSSARSASS